MDNIYSLFNCSSKEELYALVKDRDDQVESLLNYLDYAKGNIVNKNKNINSPARLKDYLAKTKLPSKDDFTMLFVDTKNKPILFERTNLKKQEEIIKSLSNGITAGSNAVFLCFEKDNIYKEQNKLIDLMETLNMKIVDMLDYNKEDNSLTSQNTRSKMYLDYDSVSESTYKLNDLYDRAEISSINKYTDFTNYYAKEEIRGKDILDDIDSIKESLKIGYQHEKQEYFGLISYDKDNKIIKVNEISQGGVSSAIVDPRVFMREVLTTPNLHGVALYHNHPSGDIEPSREDIGVVKRLKILMGEFNIEYFDKFIIGKEDVFSFSDKVHGFESDSLDYINRDMNYDLEDEYEEEFEI